MSRAASFWFPSQRLVQGITTLEGPFPIRQPGRKNHGSCSFRWKNFASRFTRVPRAREPDARALENRSPPSQRTATETLEVLGYRPRDRGPFPLPPFVPKLPRL